MARPRPLKGRAYAQGLPQITRMNAEGILVKANYEQGMMNMSDEGNVQRSILNVLENNKQQEL